MKHGLVLSGGGFKGAFQVGAVEVLLEKGIEFSAVSGVSVGALNGSQIAQNKLGNLLDFWVQVGQTEGAFITDPYLAKITKDGLVPVESKVYEIAFKNISKWDITQAIINKRKRSSLVSRVIKNLGKSKGILDNTPLHNILLENTKLEDFKVPFFFSVVSLYSGRLYELSPKDFNFSSDLAKALLASSNMPVVWEPILTVNTNKLTIINAVDGGLRMINPLSQVFNYVQNDKEDWTIWIINCNTSELPYREVYSSLIKTSGHTLEIILNEVMQNDIEFSFKVNEWADKIDKKRVQLNIIEPITSLGGTLEATPEIIKTRMQRGRLKALKHFS